MDQVVKNIRAIRSIKNFSQEYVADKIGISQAAYQKLESGRTSINIDKLKRLAEVFEISDWVDITRFHEKGLYQPQLPPEIQQLKGNNKQNELDICLERNKSLEEQVRLLKNQMSDKDEIINLLKKGN